MKANGHQGTGIIMKNRIPVPCKSKMSDNTKLQKKGRGTSKMSVIKPSKVGAMKCKDNKAAVMALSVHENRGLGHPHEVP